ncbi:BZ3500_MvSof-1268-A1-R1_Chr8-2g10213 [Microbotryum saponariae]|uniref:BZ3500_MvSof-1268-A1-R1_Chr8-2g10213 protein n=1 Tax=Microbotryum saponariae TaxID=289078 RepID=A0A2X0KR63_9BASI|nr:BZ3500_MvSof-1268-A1-R1_Chr8-2g10213 [Microbotryum saponariae]SDA02011.1 BZ3501_MvSof-1269-A2-R1_Chr8-2g09963 [Microbotryum saponariae]
MQLSGALDTTTCTTYDGAFFGISAEMINLDYGLGFKARMEAGLVWSALVWSGLPWSGLVFDGCLPRTQWQDAHYSYVLLIKEAVDPMTASINIVGCAQSPSEMFDRHFESVAIRTCNSNWYIMRKYDLTGFKGLQGRRRHGLPRLPDVRRLRKRRAQRFRVPVFQPNLVALQGGGLVDKFDATKQLCTNYNVRGCVQSCVREHACSFCKGQHEAYTHVGSA